MCRSVECGIGTMVFSNAERRVLARVGIVALLSLTHPSSAAITVTLDSIVVSPANSAHFRWTYEVALDNNSRCNIPGDGFPGPAAVNPLAPAPGDFLTLYDFGGVTGVTGRTGNLYAESVMILSGRGATPGTDHHIPNDRHYPLQEPPDNTFVTN